MLFDSLYQWNIGIMEYWGIRRCSKRPIIPPFHYSIIPASIGSHIGDDPRNHQSGEDIEGKEDQRDGAGPAVDLPDLRAPLFQHKLELAQDGRCCRSQHHERPYPGMKHLEVWPAEAGHHDEGRHETADN